MMVERTPILSARSCAWKILSLSSSAVGRVWSNQPFPSCPKQVCLKSKIEEKTPSFPMKKCNSSSVSLNTSPTVKALYLAKVRSFNSCKKGSIDWAFTRDSSTGTKPFSRSDGSERHSRSFLILIIASILKPAIPLSNHQLIIL